MEDLNSYSLRKIENFSDFLKLEKEWDALASHSEYHFPFLCFDWFRIWLKHFMGEARLLILLVERKGELVMIAPFLAKREKYKGLLVVEKVELMGNVYSPIRTFITSNLPDAEIKNCVACILEFFQHNYKAWDVLEMDSLPVEYKLVEILHNTALKNGFNYRMYHCYADWYLDDILGAGDDYLKSRSRNLRDSLRKRRNKLEKIGKLEFKVGKEKDRLEEYLDLFYKVRNKSWKSSEADLQFQRETRRLYLEKDWMRFGFLFLNGNPIASQIRIVFKHISFLMETVHDDEYDQFSPGSILRAEFAKYLIDVDKVKVFDSVKGDEPYKREWTPQRRERRGILLFGPTCKGRISAFLMTRILPIIERNPAVLKAKNRIVGFLKGKRRAPALSNSSA